MRSSSHAFSLTEMLVVIAVIGLLAALSIPAVSQVRYKAAATACMSNLRQLGIAYQAYAGDFDGTVPPAHYDTTHPLSEGHNGWGIFLLRNYYMSGPRYTWTKNGSFIVSPLEMCPVARLNKMTTSLTKGGPDYSWSDYMTGNKMLFYTTPSQTPMIWDAWGSSWISGRTLPLRHFNGLNCAYMDSHIEFIPANDPRLYSSYWYSAVKNATPTVSNLGKGTPLGSLTPP